MRKELHCKTCDAPYRFITMAESGKPMPVDIEPIIIFIDVSCHGNYVTKDGQMVKGRPRRKGEKMHGLRRVFVAHWDTCKDAAPHRKQ